MATIKFYYRSKKDNSVLTLRFLHRIDKDNDIDIFNRTELRIDKTKWTAINKSRISDVNLKNDKKDINAELLELETFVFDNIPANPKDINKDWLSNTINSYYNPILTDAINERVSYWIQRYIDIAHTLENAKGGYGLSPSRVASYKTFKKQIEEFNKDLLVKDCDNEMFTTIKDWFLERKYAPTTSNKKLSDLKRVCTFAQLKKVKVSNELGAIRVKKGNPYGDDMDVIFLSEKEIKKIEDLKLDNLSLINARKWLILACYTGQRGTTLTTRVNKDSFSSKEGKMEIRIKQIKGNKTVKIPVLPKVKEIYDTGLPYKISLQRLNDYIKELGKLAELNEMVMGTIRESIEVSSGEFIQRNVKKKRPKWMYISSHIGRRSFCCNHYGKLPTPDIMRVTSHVKESTFLQYINQENDDHLDTFHKYYENKEEVKEGKVIEFKKAN